MFDRDIRHYRAAPRTLNEAFGAYSTQKLHVPRRRFARALSAAFWTGFYGFAIAACWYVCYLARTAA